MPSTDLSAAARTRVLQLARESIERALPEGRLAPFDAEISLPELQRPGASFVTIQQRSSHDLRGCCGTLEARVPLAQDVWQNAWTSAFADPRFPPLAAAEWPAVELHVSVLSTPVPFPVTSRADLLEQLRPHIDGLVLSHGIHRATFLPSVWEQLPGAREFVGHLLMKSGLPAHFWSDEIEWARYEVEEISDETTR